MLVLFFDGNRSWFGPSEGRHTMPDDANHAAWRDYCQKLDALGVDPYAPDLPADDPRHEQVTAIVSEYKAATTHKLALPPKWEGHEPIQPVDSLPALAEWLSFQWRLVKGWELAGDKGKSSALRDAARAIRNAFRVLDWLGVDDRPERPLPADNLDTAKKQIDGLEKWIRDKHKSGWTAPAKKKPKATPATEPKSDEPASKQPAVVLSGPDQQPLVNGTRKPLLTMAQYDVVKVLLEAGVNGLTKDDLEYKSKHGDARKILKRLAAKDPDWQAVIHFPGSTGKRYRIG